MKNIYLEPNEEIISVVDRLIQSEDEEINLVVPSGAQIWQSSINLKLLKREANILNKVVTLIVSDDLGAEMAERVGFLVRKERDLPVEVVQEETQEEDQEIAQEEDQNITEIPDEVLTEEEDQEQDQIQFEPEEKVELAQSKENMIDLLVEDLVEKKAVKSKNPFALLTSWRKKIDLPIQNRKSMTDIVMPSNEESIESNPEPEPKPKLKPIQSVQIEKVPETRIFTEIEKRKGFKLSKLFNIFIIITLVMVILVGYLILPNAEINITPKTEIINFDLSVIGSRSVSQVDETLNEIPLQEVEVTKTKSKEFETTGEEEINQRARGRITIYNEYSSEDQTLLARTRFESSDGKIFRIPQSVTVPGAKIIESKIMPSSLEVEILADEPGEEYNIGSDDFTIPGFKGSPKFVGFYGRTTDSMTGGFVGKAKVVLLEDLKNAETVLIDELKQEVKQALEDQIPTDLRMVENGLKEEIFKVSSDIKEGEKAERFTMEVKVTTKALLFKEEDLKKLVDLNLISKISNDKTPIDETQKINWQTPIIDWEKGEASFYLNIEESISFQIDIQSLKENLAGQDEVEVRRYLANETDIEKARVSFWPFWVNKIPKQENKIEINIEI